MEESLESNGSTVTIQDLIQLTRRRIGLILLCTVLGLGVAIGVLQFTPKSYTASSSAYVSVRVAEDNSANTGSFYTASQLANQKAQAFSSVITSTAVADSVVTRLHLSASASEVASKVKATPVQNSSTINVTATFDTETTAKAIADAVIDVAAEQLNELEGGESPVQLRLLSSAELSAVIVTPSRMRTLALGTTGGLFIGYLITILLALLDRRIRTPEDVEAHSPVPLVAVLPQSDMIGRELLDAGDGDFRAEEALRKLRTNLMYANVDHELKICVVSSPNSNEGKTSVAIQLAKVLAASGENVVLVDADLRRPTVDSCLHIKSPIGLSQVLAGTIPVEQAVVTTEEPGLFVLPAGHVPPNPSELLSSKRMEALTQALSRESIVIFDAPPLLPVTDAAILSRIADGMLLVVSSGKTKTDEMALALDAVAQAGGKTLGIVLNRVPTAKTPFGAYGYGSDAYIQQMPEEQETDDDEGHSAATAAPDANLEITIENLPRATTRPPRS